MVNFEFIADTAETTMLPPLRDAGAPVSTSEGDYQPAIWLANGGGFRYGYVTPDGECVTFRPVEGDLHRTLFWARAATVRMVLPH